MTDTPPEIGEVRDRLMAFSDAEPFHMGSESRPSILSKITLIGETLSVYFLL
jgi:hypothetical protein